MGRQQKLKRQRRLEREQKALQKKKLPLKWVVSGGVIAAAIVFAVWITSSPTPSPTDLETESPNQESPSQQVAVLETNKGIIKFKLFKDAAPKTVENFVELADEKFYDGVKFHRVIKDFMIQTGDPLSRDDDWSDDGAGDPGYMFEDEINDYKLIRGRVAMANSGPNTNGSQFFIVTAESTPWLDGKHTVFGEVAEGMDVVDIVESVETNQAAHPMEDVVMDSVYIESNKNLDAASSSDGESDAKSNQEDGSIDFNPSLDF